MQIENAHSPQANSDVVCSTDVPTSVKTNATLSHSPGTLLWSLCGGLLAWCLVQSTAPVFGVPEQYHVNDIGAPVEKLLALSAAKAATDRNNATFELACLASLVSSALLVRRLGLTPKLVVLLCTLPLAVLSAIVAAFLGFATIQVLGILLPLTLENTVLLQSIIFSVLGLGTGCAVGVGVSGSDSKMVLACCLTGFVVGAVVGVSCPLLYSACVATSASDALLPAGAWDRLLYFSTFAAALALGMSNVAKRNNS